MGAPLRAVARLRALGPYALPPLIAACGALAAAHYRALPHVPLPDIASPDEVLPFVSVIVPARNEERNLPALLRSLLALDYPHFEIILVDDASEDATPAIARTFASTSPGRLLVIRGTGPEPGWTGKNYACAMGAAASRGDWLLFTDADTEHCASSLRAAVQMALRHRVKALSLFPQQRCLSFWERLLLPFAYQQYFVGVYPRALHRPDGSALANGQYFLIARDAYTEAGGHVAVSSSIVDDVALAATLKRAGYAPLVCRGETLVSVRMYHSLGSLAQGFTKNSAQFVREQRLAGLSVVLSTACACGIVPAILASARARNRRTLVAGGTAYLLHVLALLRWVGDFGVPRRYALLGPFAALGFTAIALSSAFLSLSGRPVRWKGRAVPNRLGARAGSNSIWETCRVLRD